MTHYPSTAAELQSIADNYHHLAVNRVSAMMGAKVELRELADKRLQTGLKVYGTEMFEYNGKRLRKELMEELADARNYALAMLWQERGL